MQGNCNNRNESRCCLPPLPSWPQTVSQEVEAACAAACSLLQLRLRAFCVLGAPRARLERGQDRAWPALVPAAHPFMRWSDELGRLEAAPLR